MNRELEFDPDARIDFDAAADWYNASEAAIKVRFIQAVDATLATITEAPLSFPVVFGSNARRALIREFPFAIFFTPQEDRILIHAVFHTSRNPIIWRGRIG